MDILQDPGSARMHRLSRQTTPVGALFGASSGEAAGIVHLGLGNFHRAHAAVDLARDLAVALPEVEALRGDAEKLADLRARHVQPPAEFLP